MSNEEILQKAIEKAVKNGLDIGASVDDYLEFLNGIRKEVGDATATIMARGIITNHDFAKAFFGEKEIVVDFESDCDGDERNVYGIAWKYHLQQMVINEDPIKYLESYL